MSYLGRNRSQWASLARAVRSGRRRGVITGRRGRARFARPRYSRRAVANLRTGGRVNVEVKNFDSCTSDVSAATTPALVPLTTSLTTSVPHNMALTPVTGSTYWLNVPKVGSNSNNRDGRVITNRAIEVNGFVGMTYTSAFGGHLATINVALVVDTQANAASPSADAGNVFQLATANDYMAATPFRNLDNSTRYRVLAHKRILPKPFVADAGAYMSRSPFRIYRRLGFKTNFTAGSTDPSASAVVDNGIFLIAWVDSVPSGTAAHNPYIQYVSRLRFVG